MNIYEITKAFPNKNLEEINELTNEQIIRGIQKYYFKEAKKSFNKITSYEECDRIYEEEHGENFDFFTSKTTKFWYNILGEYIEFLTKVAFDLSFEITYIKESEELQKIVAEYKELIRCVCGDDIAYNRTFDLNEYQNIKIDYDNYLFGLTKEEVESFGKDEEEDFAFLIKMIKKATNNVCKVYKHNRTNKLYDGY